MKWNKLIPATLVRRYKRFLADVTLQNGEIITTHCPNPGAMLGINQPGSRCYIVPFENKMPRLELIEVENTLVGVNTNIPNQLIEEALLNQLIPELNIYNKFTREVKYFNENDNTTSRIDFLLESENLPPLYLEVKNVHWKRENTSTAAFPDCVTARGSKHLLALANQVRKGNRAMVIYVTQRGDVDALEIAHDKDPQFGINHKIAKESGVEFLGYNCEIDLESIKLKDIIEVNSI